MRNITTAVSDDSHRQARILAAKNDASVSAVVLDLLLGRADEETFRPHPPPPARADSEIKSKHHFLGCDSVKINRTIRESAV
jgi:hypothetical protein